MSLCSGGEPCQFVGSPDLLRKGPANLGLEQIRYDSRADGSGASNPGMPDGTG